MDIIKKYIFKLTLMIVAVLLTIPASIVQADAEANILQIYISGQTMTVFTDVELRSDALTCTVSNQIAEITATGKLSGENSLTKTTILVDVSTSMPSVIRDGVIAALKKMTEIKSANEEFKLVVFGDELVALQDFSSDRYDLANAIDKIKFESNKSKIYDSIYNTIPRIAPSDEKPTFYRTVVITDGADNTASGITKEELFLKFQNERYPVDVVAVSRNETAENKDLATIVRMSGGRYFSFYPNIDADDLVRKLGAGDYFYFEAIIPDVLLDGVIRQVDISDGVYNISADIKIPVYNESWIEPSIRPEEETAEIFGSYTIVILIGAGIALIIIISAIIVAVFVRGKGKSRIKQEVLISETGIAEKQKEDKYSGETEFIGDSDYAKTQFIIELSNSDNPIQNWTLPINVNGDLLIGRAEHCNLRLADISVSREQCKIIVQGIGLAVVHLGSSNKTILNEKNVAESSPLQSGDTLKFGREVLHINYIRIIGDTISKPESMQNTGRGETESLF